MKKQFSRRDFLIERLSATAASVLMSAGRVHAAENNTLKVNGCSGRGRGALVNTLEADPNTGWLPSATHSVKTPKVRSGFVSSVTVSMSPDRIFDGLIASKSFRMRRGPLCETRIPSTVAVSPSIR